MNSAFETIGIDTLRPLLDRGKVIAAVRDALICQAQGRVQSPLPGQLLFDQPPGDCHIKFAQAEGAATFAVKIATGFYENPALGLPVNHGLVLIFDARTGVPRLLIKDDGWLTAWRTAAAAAIAAATLAPSTVTAIGIIGSGLQASLALQWLPETLGAQAFFICGRNRRKAEDLAGAASEQGQRVTAVDRIETLLERCNIVITTTPSRAPLFHADLVRNGTHLVAVGADSPGKQELPVELFARAAHVLTDDHAQCLDHGDFGVAVRNAAIGPDADHMIGNILSGAVGRMRAAADISIVDLTGLAVEDAAIAELFSSQLKSPGFLD